MSRIPVLLLALCASALAQGPKILIVTDMEGVGGGNNADEQLLPGQRRFEESRRLLTGEINAAVEGALEAGASEAVIWDGHDGSRTLAIDEIHPKAKLIQGKPTPPDYYLSEKLYDGILFVGQHAMAGAKGGVLAHSQSFSVQNIFLNGKPVGEIGQEAAIAGYFSIPVIMPRGRPGSLRRAARLAAQGGNGGREAPGGQRIDPEPFARRGPRPHSRRLPPGGGPHPRVHALED